MEYLTESAEIKCPHGGTLKLPTPEKRSLKINGKSVLCKGDLFEGQFVGCTQAGPGMKPCTKVIQVLHGESRGVTINGKTPLLNTILVQTDGSPPGISIPATTFPGKSVMKINPAKPPSQKGSSKKQKPDSNDQAINQADQSSQDSSSEKQKPNSNTFVDLLYVPETDTIYPITEELIDEICEEEKKLNDTITPLLNAINSDNQDQEEIDLARKQFLEQMKQNSIGKKEDLKEVIRLGKAEASLSYLPASSFKNITKRLRKYSSKKFLKSSNNKKKKTIDKKELVKKAKKIGDNLRKEGHKLRDDYRNTSYKFSWKFDKSQWFTDMVEKIDGLVETKVDIEEKKYRNNLIDFDISKGSQWHRFTGGASAELTFNDTNKAFPSVGLGTKVEGKYSVWDGMYRATGYLPDAKGGELSFKMPLKKDEESDTDEESYTWVNLGRFRFDATFSLSGFAGASVTLYTELEIGNSNTVRGVPSKAQSETGVDFFAGVSVTGTVLGTLRWLNPNEDKTEFSGDSDEILVSAEASASASLGLGATWQIRIGFNKGVFFMKAAAGLVIKAGAKGDVSFIFQAENIYNLITFIFSTLYDKNFDYLKFVEETAFKLLENYTMLAIIAGETISQTYNNYSEKLEKAIEEEWDAFWGETELQKMSERILAGEEDYKLKYSVPEVKGRLLDQLCYGFWSSDDKKQERAILRVLGWVQNKHEYKKILKVFGKCKGRKIPTEVNGEFNWEGLEYPLLYFLDGKEDECFRNWKKEIEYTGADKGSKIKFSPTMQEYFDKLEKQNRIQNRNSYPLA